MIALLIGFVVTFSMLGGAIVGAWIARRRGRSVLGYTILGYLVPAVLAGIVVIVLGMLGIELGERRGGGDGTMLLEGWLILTMAGVLLPFFISSQKNLNVAAYIVAGLVFPVPTLIAVAVDPARDFSQWPGGRA